VKKDVKSKVAAKKWLDGKSFNNKNSGCQILVKHGEGNTNSPELLLLKFLSLAYHQVISWPPPWISNLFSQCLLGGRTLFYSWAVLD